MVIIKEATVDDAISLASRLRADDVEELKGLGSTPEKSLLNGFIYSEQVYSVWLNNKVITMFGVTEIPNTKNGAIWALGSDELFSIPITFVKEGRKWIKHFLKSYDAVGNIVDCRNTLHIKWLKHCGVTFLNTITINNLDYLQFIRTK